MKSTRVFVDTNRVIDRLRRAYKLESDAELARFLDVNPSTVATWRAKKTMKYDRIIERAGEVNLHWLLTGDGHPRIESTDSNHRANLPTGIPFLESEQLDYSDPGSLLIQTQEPDLDPAGSEKILLSLPDTFVRQELKSDPKDLFLFRAPGDSMEPTFRHRDFVLVNRSIQHPLSGRIFLIRWNQGLVCKRVQELPGGRLQLLSDNPSYPPIEIDRENERPELIGLVVWVARSL